MGCEKVSGNNLTTITGTFSTLAQASADKTGFFITGKTCASVTVLILFIMMPLYKKAMLCLRIITASNIRYYEALNRKISARHFEGISQWLTGIRL